MQSGESRQRKSHGFAVVLAATVLAAANSAAPCAAVASPLQAAGAAPAAAPGSRLAGTVTAVSGNVLTVKDDKGILAQVTVPDSARVLELPAGAKSLSAATPIKVADIAVGDRILARTTSDGSNFTASTVVAMKQADVAKMQQHEVQEWRTNGVSGLVKSVDPTGQTLVISTGSGPTAKTITVQVSKTTAVRRYAPDSTKFDDAKPATLEEIKPGDQLRARGAKSADGAQLAADAIVAGTFRNLAGTVVSVDPAANTVTITDLATKKPVVVSVNADSQLHKLSPAMAQGMAMRLKGGADSGGARSGGGSNGAAAAPGGSAGSANGGAGSGSGQGHAAGSEGGQGSSGTPGQRGGDIQQALNRAPVLALADLKKGDAVMVLTTEGQNPGAATAVTLLAGVEPLLQASPGASQSVLSASWSVGGAAPGGQDAQ